MPTIQNNRITQPLGFIDHKSKQPVNIIQSVDITDLCQFDNKSVVKIIIDYAQTKDRVIVAVHKINTCAEIDTVIYFFLTIIENISSFPDFYTWAKILGLEMSALKKILIENAPTVPATVE